MSEAIKRKLIEEAKNIKDEKHQKYFVDLIIENNNEHNKKEITIKKLNEEIKFYKKTLKESKDTFTSEIERLQDEFSNTKIKT